MKFLPLFLTLLCPWLAAQSGELLSVEPASVVKEILVDVMDENYEDATAITVTNNGNRKLQLIRELEVATRPRGWNYGHFHQGRKSAPFVPTAEKAGETVTLLPGESTTYYVTLRPDGIPGSGRVELRFSDLTSPGTVLATASFATKVASRQVREETEQPRRPIPTRIGLYPNPATDKFFLEVPAGKTVGKVEISNTLGRQMRAYNGKPSKEGFDIESLPDGLYLISVYDEKGNKLKTLRLLHRRFGA